MRGLHATRPPILPRARLVAEEGQPTSADADGSCSGADPNYVDGLALARADLTLKEEAQAATIFREMLKGFGDTAELHMDIGLQYAETDYSEQAEREFKKAIAENDKLPGAHYSLGRHLQNMGEINFPRRRPSSAKNSKFLPTTS